MPNLRPDGADAIIADYLRRNGDKVRLIPVGGEWIRFILAGVIAGVLAYAGVSARISVLETEMTISDRDRASLQQTVNLLTSQIATLTIEVRAAATAAALEREARSQQRGAR